VLDAWVWMLKEWRRTEELGGEVGTTVVAVCWEGRLALWDVIIDVKPQSEPRE